MRPFVVLIGCLLAVDLAADRVFAEGGHVFWTSGDRLLPAWGFYPNGASYGNTAPLGQASAWTAGGGTHTLTWVATFHADSLWQVWVRQYGGYGKVDVTVDERTLAEGRGGAGGGRYVWRHLGAIRVSPGHHHVDLTITRGMLDAVLFASDPDFDPAQAELPPPVEAPLLRGLRTYRDDSHLAGSAGAGGFVVGRASPYVEVRYDWLPHVDELSDRLSLWGAGRQYVAGTFVVRAWEPLNEFRASLEKLVGPNGATLEAAAIDLRVVHLRHRSMTLPATRLYADLYPDLLLRDARTDLPPQGDQGGFGGGACTVAIPAHQSRQVWLTIQVPAKASPGIYRGTLLLSDAGSAQRRKELLVELDVLPVDLQPVEGYYSIYYPSQPLKPERANYVSPERYRAELEDQVRHGLNSTTLYGGFETLPMAAEAGMTRAPCLMHWPGGDAHQQISAARELGFDGLLYYGVDEPRTPEQIERCLSESARRNKLGLPMFTAINSRQAQQALGDAVSHPVYNLWVFDGPDNAVALRAREQGRQAVSYWTTQTAFPLLYRALSGLYNTRCGYQGTAPWAYQDYPDARLYTEPAHAVAYPDADGRPIPTLRWAAIRDGIDDVRYLQALDRMLAVAEARMAAADPPAQLAATLERARQERADAYESIGGRWFQYTGNLLPGDLDQVRRRLADATASLDQLMSSD
ncbi:MAG: DUF4091 domain-containing protein [Pirellulaceae bacterium]|nr:DUF4091 domain-containing protein [Pirellulaceae bacterium]